MAKQSTPKTMSSRLMTMKFMQRGAAAAAAAASASGTPVASSPASPRSEDGSAKRRKFAHTPSSAAGSPATPLFDQKAIQAAMEEEEKKRQAAIEKRAAELGDSHWVLEGASALPAGGSRPLLNVVQVGFSQIDYAGVSTGDDDPFDMGSVPAQTQIRRFNMKKPKACSRRRRRVKSYADNVPRLLRKRMMRPPAVALIPALAQMPKVTLKTRAPLRHLETSRAAAGTLLPMT
jgi:hypothetical protein